MSGKTSKADKSPWRNAKPRKPLSDYQPSPSTSRDDDKITCSPPNSNFKESTRMEISLPSSPPSAVPGPGSGLDLSQGASPHLARGEEGVVTRGKRTTNSSYTKIKNNSQRKNSFKMKGKIPTSDDELTEDDQPSGKCQYVGNSSRVSNLSSSTLNNQSLNTTTTSNTSHTRQRKKELPPSTSTTPVCPSVPEEETSTKSLASSLCSWVSIIFVSSVLIVMYALASHPQGRPDLFSQPASLLQSVQHWDQAKDQVKQGIKVLRIKFPNQTRSSWVQISSTLKSPMQVNPDYPGVLLLLSTPSARPTSICLARHLLNLTTRALSQPGVLPPPLSELTIPSTSLPPSPHIAKTHLTDFLHSALSHGGSAAILDLESVHPVAALTLHAFADNSNAPHKQSVLLFTLATEVMGEQLETRVERTLVEKWEAELGPDKLYALVSRLVVNVVEVEQESVGALGDLCSG